MPLTFDFPWEKLVTSQGTNPRPSDHEAYWDKALTEMRALDPQVELVPAAFQAPFAECFHMYFTGVGGARVHAKLLRPKNASAPHPAVLMFHGYSGHSGDWNDKLGYVARGCTVAALDCRAALRRLHPRQGFAPAGGRKGERGMEVVEGVEAAFALQHGLPGVGDRGDARGHVHAFELQAPEHRRRVDPRQNHVDALGEARVVDPER